MRNAVVYGTTANLTMEGLEMKRIKKIVAMLQVVFLLGAMLPITTFETSEVQAAVSGITNGGSYMIVSAYNGKAITQTDLSMFYDQIFNNNVVAMKDAAKSYFTTPRLQKK